MEETFLFLLLSYALTPSLSQRERESPNSESHLATRFAATILNSTNHHAQTLRSENSQPATEQQALSAKGFRFAVVASRWNDSIVSRLIAGARDALEELLADEDAVEIFRVPGSFEIPLCALKAAESGKFDAVICLGVIIRGETPHFDYIAAETARGIGEASLKTGVPLLFGVITADNIDQAIDRAREKLNNKGFEAARAAVELVNLYREAFTK